MVVEPSKFSMTKKVKSDGSQHIQLNTTNEHFSFPSAVTVINVGFGGGMEITVEGDIRIENHSTGEYAVVRYF